MRKDIFLLSVGIGVFLVPFLGIPESWKDTLLFVLGSGVVIGALVCRFETRQNERQESEVNYKEHQPDTVPYPAHSVLQEEMNGN